MYVVECPNCRIELDLEPADVGHLVECPACLHRFTGTATGAITTKPPVLKPVQQSDLDDERIGRQRWRDADDLTPRRRSAEADEYASPKELILRTQSRLATPGGGLEVLGWIDVVAGVIGLIFGLVMLAVSSSGDPLAITLLVVAPGVSGIVLGGLKAFGGRAMKTARNRTLAVLAAIAGCVPLNINLCMSWILFPAYIVSIVFGIMALAVLFKPDTKKAFEMNRPGGDTDAV